MATAFGFGAFAPPAESLAPGDPATRAKQLPALRSGHTVLASMKPWCRKRRRLAQSPAASACALFAPQPAHAQLRFTTEVIGEWGANRHGPPQAAHDRGAPPAPPQHGASPAAPDG